jgi:Flp pilus assembly protein TadD
MARLTLLALLLFAVLGPAVAVGPDSSVLDSHPDYRDFQMARAREDWRAALPPLERLLAEHPDEPEVANWLGFVHRKLRDYPTARRFYDRALEINPNYLPALEYQGMWFVETGDLASARANLARLETLCGRCHEWEDLAEAVARAGAGQ